MTNFEYYKDEILKIAENNDIVALKNGKPIECRSIPHCAICAFFESGKSCKINFIRWLCAEYKPQPKLTKKERLFCELVETGWLTRGSSRNLYWYRDKPSIVDCSIIAGSVSFTIVKELGKFNFIESKDTEPWAVEDLLKLEVEE